MCSILLGAWIKRHTCAAQRQQRDPVRWPLLWLNGFVAVPLSHPPSGGLFSLDSCYSRAKLFPWMNRRRSCFGCLNHSVPCVSMCVWACQRWSQMSSWFVATMLKNILEIGFQYPAWNKSILLIPSKKLPETGGQKHKLTAYNASQWLQNDNKLIKLLIFLSKNRKSQTLLVVQDNIVCLWLLFVQTKTLLLVLFWHFPKKAKEKKAQN